MQRRILLRIHLLYSLLFVCILVGLLSAFHVNAEGISPRQRHRANAIMAGRRHYRRANDTNDVADTFSTGTSNPLHSAADTPTSGNTPAGTDSNNTLADISADSNPSDQHSDITPADTNSNSTHLDTTSDSTFLDTSSAISSDTSSSSSATSTADTSGTATETSSNTSESETTSANDFAAEIALTDSFPTGTSVTDTASPGTSATDPPTTGTSATDTVTSGTSASPTITDTSASTQATSDATSDTADDISSTSTSFPAAALDVLATTDPSTSADSPTGTANQFPTVTDDQSTDPATQTFPLTTTDSVTLEQPGGATQTTTATGDTVQPTRGTENDAVITSNTATDPLPTVAGNATAGDAETANDSVSKTGPSFATQSPADGSVNSGTRSGANATTLTNNAALPTPPPQFRNDTRDDSAPKVIPTTSTSPVSSNSAWLPTALITAATAASNSSLQATGSDPPSSAQATEAPSTPKIITPADGIPSTPSNSTLVRIGFLESLNYPFVVQNSVTVAQIFQVLPLAVSYALQIPGSEVTVRSLQPYPLSQYTATVALLWVPQDQVDSLQVQILATNSRLYSQSDATAQQLVDLIDPTIPLVAVSSVGNAGTPAVGTSTPDGNSNLSNSGANSGSLDNVQSQNSSASSSSTGKQLAIGIGAAAAAIGYATLMFLGAKRFRRQSVQAQIDRRHSRVSSITGERAASPPLAHSYRSSGTSSGRGVRGQNISAPLMTENSLLL